MMTGSLYVWIVVTGFKQFSVSCLGIAFKMIYLNFNFLFCKMDFDDMFLFGMGCYLKYSANALSRHIIFKRK